MCRGSYIKSKKKSKKRKFKNFSYLAIFLYVNYWVSQFHVMHILFAANVRHPKNQKKSTYVQTIDYGSKWYNVLLFSHIFLCILFAVNLKNCKNRKKSEKPKVR